MLIPRDIPIHTSCVRRNLLVLGSNALDFAVCAKIALDFRFRITDYN